MRTLFKHVVASALLTTGAADLLGRSARRFGLVLAYHNIVPAGESPSGDRSLHLPQRDFSAQLDLLQRAAEVVPLATLLEGAGPGSRPRVAITFDDAYRGAVAAGVEELQARDLPATIFVAPAFLGGRSFWWDAVADSSRGLSTAARAHALENCAGQDSAVRTWASSIGVALQSPAGHSVAASEGELQRALEYPGMTLGSHTWSHPNLTRLTDSELATELTQSLDWLLERFPRVIPWLTYPYGLSDARVELAAETAGYIGALRVDGGWLGACPSRFALPRFNVPAGISPAGFQLRMAGMFCR